MKNMQYWSGTKISKLEESEVFLYGSNVLGWNGAGAAKAAMLLGKEGGAKNGVAHGFNGSNTYALLTKILPGQEGVKDPKNGFIYTKTGYKSVSTSQIRSNIKDLYDTARTMPEKAFLISYQLETWPNGSPKKSLNGYTSQEMLEMFAQDNIPDNIVFHDSYKPHLEKILKKDIKAFSNNEVISFTKVALPYGWLGNMAPFPVDYNNVTYPTTEALFQALRFSNHPEIQKEIIHQKSPMNAKLIAKGHKKLLEKEGYELLGQQDIENMKLCIKLKLEQYPELAQQLIDTQNSPIIEDCSSRPQGSGLFWGAEKTGNNWKGENVLGKVWMEYRKQLQNNQELSLTFGNEMTINNTTVVEQPKEYTFFFHLTSPFSNFHPAKFEYKEITFISNEQFMMYSKAKTFGDEETAKKIIELNNTPLAQQFLTGQLTREQIVNNKDYSEQWNKLMMKVKYLGREVNNYDEDTWVEKRPKVVLFGAREKFTQNEDLKQILLATDDTTMVEASKFDKIWGIGLDEFTAKKTDPAKWPGQNLLGKVLDQLKIEFKNNLAKKMKP